MPAKKRTSKRRPEEELSFPQLMDLLLFGPLGTPGDDRRERELWECEEDRAAAYWAHRDRVLRGFPESGTPPPKAVDYYEPVGGDLHRAAVEYFLSRITEERDRTDRTNAKYGWLPEPAARACQDDRIAALEALLEGVPDSGAARRIYRDRVTL